MVWDPKVELIEKYDHSTEGDLSPDESWVSEGYELPTDEVIEVIRPEIIPPVNASSGLIEEMYVELLVDGNPIESIHITPFMAPAHHPLNPGKAPNFGVPLLWRPFLGRLPTPMEAKCPKLKEGQLLQVRVTAIDKIDTDFSIKIVFARVRGEGDLKRVVGASFYNPSFTLDGIAYTKDEVPITIGDWTALPGGRDQSVPKIQPWWTFAKNKQATTPNRWYHFTYPTYVDQKWQELEWNLVKASEAYNVEYLSVHPNANSYKTRIYKEGRTTNPEFLTRPLPELNEFLPGAFEDTSVNASLKASVEMPTKLDTPVLFHNVKGGIQHVDNGTSIPANGVLIEVIGTKFILRGGGS